MSIRRFLRTPRARRALAAGAIVLSVGGLVLYRSPVGATSPTFVDEGFLTGTRFHGPGASGSLALSHGMVLAHGRQTVMAELVLKADEIDVARERAPLSLVIMLDTSGSMAGDKLEQAKRSVIRMIEQMRPEDEVAFVRYDSFATLVQPMARVSSVKTSLIRQIQTLESGGGTNIPAALAEGLAAVRDARSGRVQRMVLVSDGLDSTRAEAERLAEAAAERATTVSALGVGLDFDESYMASVARFGHGNFGFVKDAEALVRFLERELDQTAKTTLERAVARLRLPSGLSFVRAVGADARVGTTSGSDELVLSLGSLFSGDQRRVVIELEASAGMGASLPINGDVEWDLVAGEHAAVRIQPLAIAVTDDADAVRRARDGRVFASAVSALASLRQLEAAEAYSRGDVGRAQQLIDDNVTALREARAAAPTAAASALAKQEQSYASDKGAFRAAPGSPEGRSASKRVTEKDAANIDRSFY